jgi:hypothetical protein
MLKGLIPIEMDERNRKRAELSVQTYKYTKEKTMAAVELYADSDFRKKLVETNSDSSNVGDGVNDRVTSIVINEGTWRFFTDSQFRGVSADFGSGRYPNIGLGTIPNDSITSFQRIG